jgi:hypothetical protein
MLIFPSFSREYWREVLIANYFSSEDINACLVLIPCLHMRISLRLRNCLTLSQNYKFACKFIVRFEKKIQTIIG